MIRQTRKEDLHEVMQIIDDAKKYFKDQQINQWQDGYPNKDTILVDIENQEAYVLEIDHEIVATCMISNQVEPTYDYIEGKWLTYDTYTVIHRIATKTSQKGKGIAGQFIDFATTLYPKNKSIRMDTHEQNVSMQRFFDKNGFIYCGIIYLANKDKRKAYEKRI